MPPEVTQAAATVANTPGVGDFLIKLIVAFGGLAGLIVGILAWNKDRLKIRIEEGTVKRKEVADILQKLYDDLRAELDQQRKEHREELDRLKLSHDQQIDSITRRTGRRISALYAILKKKDAIIRELVYRLPVEARDAVQAKIDALEQEIYELEALPLAPGEEPDQMR